MHTRAPLHAALMLLATAAAAAPPTALQALLPDPAAPPEWRAPEPPAVYERGTLSNFIDGGAEVYIQYGFARAVNQEYVRGDDTIACSIYEMRDAQAAFGVFSYFRTPYKTPVAIGDGGVSADLQLAFWQDRYYVVIDTFSTTPATHAALPAFARAISDKIQSHGVVPAALRRLPAGFASGTEKLYAGDLAASALHAAVPAWQIAPGSDAVLVTAEYVGAAGTAKLLVLPLASPDSLESAWRALAAALRADGSCAMQEHQATCGNDARRLVLRRTGDALIAVAGASPAFAEQLLTEAGR